MDQLEDKDPFGLTRLDDPEFEERERARLTGSDNNEVPSPEIQEAFVDYAKESQLQNEVKGKFDIRPENLFYGYGITDGSYEFFNRYHYKRPTKKHFSANDLLAELRTIKQPNGKSYAEIEKYGEGPSFSEQQTESLDVSFIPPKFESREHVDFDLIGVFAKFGGRELGVFYEENGNLSTFLHKDKDNVSVFYVSRNG